MVAVSVIIPCFNAASTIAEAIDAALSQTWTDMEIIVVDDGSTDGSDSYVEENYGQVLRLIRQNNRGAAAARNIGATHGAGRHLLFLDADDSIEPRFLEGLVAAIELMMGDLAVGQFVLEWPEGVRIDRAPKWGDDPSAETMLAAVLTDGWIAVHAILWRAEFFWRIGGWNEKLWLYLPERGLRNRMLIEPSIASMTEFGFLDSVRELPWSLNFRCSTSSSKV